MRFLGRETPSCIQRGGSKRTRWRSQPPMRSTRFVLLAFLLPLLFGSQERRSEIRPINSGAQTCLQLPPPLTTSPAEHRRALLDQPAASVRIRSRRRCRNSVEQTISPTANIRERVLAKAQPRRCQRIPLLFLRRNRWRHRQRRHAQLEQR